ncbi:MAG: flagellin [Hyphomonadaceae bacterium]
MTASLQTLRFNTQAQLDVARITRDLTDLQRQVASGYKSSDLSGYGAGVSRLLNTRGLVDLTDARANAASQLSSRFGVQAAALDQAAASSQNLAQAIRDAIGNDNANALPTELPVAFAGVVSAMNETWNGQPLFAGERLSGNPVKINSMAELMAASGPADIYDEAQRTQVVDFGPGAQIALADKASTLSQGVFDAMKALKNLIDSWGGNIPTSLSQSDRDQLLTVAQSIDTASNVFIGAEGNAGQLQQRIANEQTRLQDRSTLLQKEISDQADADPAQLSIQINTLLVQYQATAKTFSDISSLSLVNFLR